MLEIRRGTGPTALQTLTAFKQKANLLGRRIAKDIVSDWKEVLSIKEEVNKSDEEVLLFIIVDNIVLLTVSDNIL